MKKRKGERERPCPRCEEPVRYLKGKTDVNGRFERQREGWHWVNSNGSHHRCADFVEVGANAKPTSLLDMAWRAAMERDNGPYEVARVE